MRTCDTPVVSVSSPSLEVTVIPPFSFLKLFDGRLDTDIDVLALEGLLDHLAHGRVLCGEEPVATLEHRDVRAEPGAYIWANSHPT